MANPALRRQRILRLLDEALAQGAVATQEDLARAIADLGSHHQARLQSHASAEGICLPARGNLQGIGRGQTHKAQNSRDSGWQEKRLTKLPWQSRHSVSLGATVYSSVCTGGRVAAAWFAN